MSVSDTQKSPLSCGTGQRKEVYLSRHFYGYKVIMFDDKEEVIASFFGKDAKKQALEFARKEGYRIVFTPR
jgi:hypothetical protein